MKHSFKFLIPAVLLAFGVSAQNQWRINGNAADENHFLGTTNPFALKVRTNDVERLRITPNGNIGIGTTTPAVKFDVYGDAIFRNKFSLPNLEDTEISNKKIVLTDEFGNLTKTSLGELMNNIYTAKNNCLNANVLRPTWSSDLNMIFSPCPQVNVSIGTENPNFFGKLFVKNNNSNAGIMIDQTELANDYSKLMYATINNPTTEIIKIDNIQANYTPFLLSASGGMKIHNGIRETFQLETDGTLRTIGALAIGSFDLNANLFGKLVVKNSTNGAGIMIDQTELTADYSKIIYAEITNPSTEIIKVYNPQANYTPFLLSTSGSMEIHNGIRETFQLETDGTLRTIGALAIGSFDLNANLFGKLMIKNSTNGAGIMIDQTELTADYSKVIYATINNPSTEIIKIDNIQANYTPFSLSAAGKMVVHNGQEKTLQLETDGTLYSRKIILNVYDNWPDYVFEKEYSLMPISELKTYISTNKHLPKVPSAKVVAEEGIDVAEMNKLLLQKIEEMTLYLIEQDNRIKELEEKIKP